MAATQIESFCERCGTKYAFEQPGQRGRVLKGLGRSLGILGEDGAHEGPGASRDPFHGVFRFCLECRQYTCPSCWNEQAGFCQGCVPLPESPDMGDFEAAAAMEAATHVHDALAELRTLGTVEAWPDADLPQPETDELVAETVAVAELEPEPVAELVVEPEPEPAPIVFASGAGVVVDTDELFAGPWHDFAADGEPSEDMAASEDWAALAPPPVEPEPVVEVVAAEPEPVVEVEPELQLAAEVEVERLAATDKAAQPELELVAEVEPLAATAESEPVVDVVAAEPEVEVELELVAEVEPLAVSAEPELELAAEVEPPAVSAEPEPVVEVVAAEPEVEVELELVAEIEVEPLAATAASEPELELVAEIEVEPLAATADSEPELIPEPVAAVPEPEPMRELPLAAMTPHPAPALAPRVQPGPSIIASPATAAAPPSIASSAAPASRLAALFGRGRKQAEEPTAVIAPEPRLASGWRVTAPDETVWPPHAPVYAPPAAPKPQAAQSRPSLLGPRPGSGHAAGAPSGIRPCYQCALPLSATARFCRRCGTPQQPGA
jgi:hypothetical protein